MFCINCGKEIKETSNFCPECGYKVENVDKVIIDVSVGTPDLGNNENEKEEKINNVFSEKSIQADDSMTEYTTYCFVKKKMLGYITYKRVDTRVEILPNNTMKLFQEISKFIGKDQKEERELFISDIQSAGVRTVWDFWDTLYAVIFIIFGFFEPIIFLLAILFAYCGYGKDIELRLSDGSKINIPCSGKGKDIEAFLLDLNKPDEKEDGKRIDINLVKQFMLSRKGIIAGISVVVAVVLMLLLSSDDPINELKEATLPSYSVETTIGEAFETFFTEPKWSTYESGDEDIVIFTGFVFSDAGEKIKVTMEMLVGEESIQWEEVVLYNVNEGNTTYLTDLELESLLGAIYEGGIFRWNW